MRRFQTALGQVSVGILMLLMVGCSATASNHSQVDTLSSTPTPSASPKGAVAEVKPEPEPVPQGPKRSVVGSANVTSTEGYTYTISFEARAESPTLDVTHAPPGKTIVTVDGSVDITVKNTTPSRALPSAWFQSHYTFAVAQFVPDGSKFCRGSGACFTQLGNVFIKTGEGVIGPAGSAQYSLTWQHNYTVPEEISVAIGDELSSDLAIIISTPKQQAMASADGCERTLVGSYGKTTHDVLAYSETASCAATSGIKHIPNFWP